VRQIHAAAAGDARQPAPSPVPWDIAACACGSGGKAATVDQAGHDTVRLSFPSSGFTDLGLSALGNMAGDLSGVPVPRSDRRGCTAAICSGQGFGPRGFGGAVPGAKVQSTPCFALAWPQDRQGSGSRGAAQRTCPRASSATLSRFEVDADGAGSRHPTVAGQP